MGQIWDFLRSVSVRFGASRQNVLKLILKRPRFVPFGGQSDPILTPNLTLLADSALLWRRQQLAVKIMVLFAKLPSFITLICVKTGYRQSDWEAIYHVLSPRFKSLITVAQARAFFCSFKPCILEHLCVQVVQQFVIVTGLVYCVFKLCNCELVWMSVVLYYVIYVYTLYKCSSCEIV